MANLHCLNPADSLSRFGFQMVYSTPPSLVDEFLSSIENGNDMRVKDLVDTEARGDIVNLAWTKVFNWSHPYKMDVRTIMTLVKLGANLDSTSMFSYLDGHESGECKTALEVAIDRENFNVVKALIDVGADVNRELECEDRYGGQPRTSTPLLRAVRTKNKDIIKLLVKSRANINSSGKHNYSPLTCSIDEGLDDITELLLDLGANVNTPDRHNISEYCDYCQYHGYSCGCADISKDYTPLMYAIRNGNSKLAKCLIDKGAEVNMTNSYLDTALTMALESENFYVMQLLIREGATVSDKDIEMMEKLGCLDLALEILKQIQMKDLKEELMERAWHPNRVENWLGAGCLDSILGC